MECVIDTGLPEERVSMPHFESEKLRGGLPERGMPVRRIISSFQAPTPTHNP
jgi:hypothetical protein